MYSKFKVACAVLFCVLMVGCAGKIKPMPAEEVSSLSQKKVALAYFYPDKKINYNELVYKVLWNEYRSNSVSFSGLWDVESDLSNRYLARFREMGISADLASELLDKEQFALLQEDSYSYLRGVNEAAKNKGKNFPTFRTSESYRKTLSEKGVDYLILVSQFPFNFEVYSLFDNIQMHSQANVRVIKTSNGEESFNGIANMGYNGSYEESPREIESHSLKIFKEIVASGVDSQFEPNRLPTQMGFTQPQ